MFRVEVAFEWPTFFSFLFIKQNKTKRVEASSISSSLSLAGIWGLETWDVA
jgi:hypothetical protein